MATVYPGAIDGAPATHADVSDAMLAIENELGTDPAGAFATLKARLAAAEFTYRSGGYYVVEGLETATATPTLNQLQASPFRWESSVTADRIGVRVNAGVASATIRLGVYASAAGGLPGSLILDAGTIDASTAGFKEIIISQAFSPGTYWLAVCAQGATTALNATVNRSQRGVGSTAGQGAAGSQGGGLVHSGSITGALPATFVFSSSADRAYGVNLRVA